MNKLIEPTSVIASHANQPSTSGGKIIKGTGVDNFVKMSTMPVYLPLSGITMSFDGEGNLLKGANS